MSQTLHPQPLLSETSAVGLIHLPLVASQHHVDQLFLSGGLGRNCIDHGAIPHHGDVVADLKQLVQPVGDKYDGHAFGLHLPN